MSAHGAPAGGVSVRALSLTPVKGCRIQRVERVELTRSGARDDRRFYVIDDRDRMVNGKQRGQLQAVVALWDGQERRLTLTFPDGSTAAGAAEGAEPVMTRFYSHPREARLVPGPFSEALSEFAGASLRLVEGGPAVDRGGHGGVSLVSTGSLQRLAEEGELSEGIDARRFRMLVEVDGVAANEEDMWVGRTVQVGPEAVVRFEGHVGRCLITSRDPESGEIDVPTLDLLFGYRHGLDTTEPLALGIYGAVTREGVVRVGDPVSLLDG